VGRSEELEFVERQTTARAGPAGVVLAGAPGVGKTRLAREALAAAGRRGALTHWLAATQSSRHLPLAPFVMALGPVAAMAPLDAMRYMLDSLSRSAGPRPIFVGIDDAHLLDDLSAVLVRQLVLRRTATAVLTLRTGELAPDAVSGLWKDGYLVRVELQPLSREETASLLEAVLGGPVDTLAAGRLWRTTRGNALYLRQLVDGEWRAGRLTDDAGVWRWSGNVTLSSGLLELIENRIGQLPAEIGDVLDMLALGEPLPVAVLARMTGRDAVERAEARGLVEFTGPDRAWDARLAHPLYGELRRARCGWARTRRLRGEIALALAEQASGTVLRRAVLTLDSDLPHEPDLLAAGAGRALELLDLPLGVRLARAAAAGHRGFEPRLTLGYALGWSGLGEETESVLAELAGDCATDAELTEVTLCRVGNMFWCLARQHAAEAMLDEAERVVQDPAARLELSAIRSACDAWLARPQRAAEAAARVLADPSSSAAAQVFAAWGAATAQCGLGRPSELESVLAGLDRSAGTFRTRTLWAGVDVAWNRALRLTGRLADAERAARPYQDSMLDTIGGPHQLGSIVCGELARDQGRVTTSARLLRQAWARVRNAKTYTWIFYIPVHLTTALAMAGDAAGARRSLADLGVARDPVSLFMEPEVHLARAWVAAAEGVVSEAVTLAHRAAEVAADQHQAALECYALHTAVCFGDPTPAGRLGQLATQIEGPRAPAAAAHAMALAAGDGAALLDASARLEDFGAILVAADAAAQAAAAHHGQGKRGSAHLAAARAQRLAAACQGARTPALTALTRPLPLTAREREIATLVAAGLTNREIAERLVVSVRTVEGHLYRATTKLGVTDRAQLAELLPRPEPET
jgi:DNA-binding NarL/FixJ family response regulator